MLEEGMAESLILTVLGIPLAVACACLWQLLVAGPEDDAGDDA
jgi:hypothetical protein